MIWESPLSNKHGPLFADTCENLMEGHHGGPPQKLLTLLLYEAFSVTILIMSAISDQQISESERASYVTSCSAPANSAHLFQARF